MNYSSAAQGSWQTPSPCFSTWAGAITVKRHSFERKADRDTLLWVRGGGPDELATGRLTPFLFFVLTGSSAGSLGLRIRVRGTIAR